MINAVVTRKAETIYVEINDQVYSILDNVLYANGTFVKQYDSMRGALATIVRVESEG
jgi:hypothetical protein